MAARAEGTSARALFATLLMVVGLCTSIMGATAFGKLYASYRYADLALTETPVTFQAWIFGLLADQKVPHEQEALSNRIAARLVTMPLVKRRAAVMAMMTNEFWIPLTPKGQTPRAIQQAVRDGVHMALAESAAAGDLYLMAAWLESRLDGFGSRGHEMLRASRLFAPRELPILMSRLRFAPLIWPLLTPDERALIKADLETVRRVRPGQAEAMEQALAKDGVVFQ